MLVSSHDIPAALFCQLLHNTGGLPAHETVVDGNEQVFVPVFGIDSAEKVKSLLYILFHTAAYPERVFVFFWILGHFLVPAGGVAAD